MRMCYSFKNMKFPRGNYQTDSACGVAAFAASAKSNDEAAWRKSDFLGAFSLEPCHWIALLFVAQARDLKVSLLAG